MNKIKKINAKALIVDDEIDICELIELSFQSIGIECTLAESVSEAITHLKKTQFDLCITDLRLGDDDGFTLIKYIQENRPQTPVVMITAHGNIESAVEALKKGAFDFISKPFELENLRNIAMNAIKASKNSLISESATHDKNQTELSTEGHAYQEDEISRRILGKSKAIRDIHYLIRKVARSQAPVLIHGESGTGKELVAKSIHEASSRKDGIFIAINCGAIPEHLVESEFFGYKKGSFTGADKDKIGLFQAANGGTLFLDEVADLALSMQVKLLRAIQERSIRMIGGISEISIDVRIISATHKSLEKMVAEGLFRQDLYYRLNVISLEIPPLRARREDLPILCQFLLSKINEKNDTAIKMDKKVIKKLMDYPFPGNIRELENILERACIICDGTTLMEEDLFFTSNFEPSTADEVYQKEDEEKDVSLVFEDNSELAEICHKLMAQIPLDINLEQLFCLLERELITRMLKETKQNKSKAAERLGMSFRSFRYRAKKLDIK